MAKRKKHGRWKDHYWKFVKFQGDLAIYAKCSCGFLYPCYKGKTSVHDLHKVQDPEQLYRYCPNCGSKKKWYIDEVEKIDSFRWEYGK